MNALSAAAPTARAPLVLAFCFLAALCEGYDVQAAGVAAAGIAGEFHASPRRLGLFFSAGSFGLMLGAIAGGRLADVIGRKAVLVASIASFGVFALATSFAWSMESLAWMRFLTGFGLGGAMPNLIALAADMSRDSSRNASIAMTYIGMPIGGSIASFTVAALALEHWRAVFWIGGATPIVIALAMALLMPASSGVGASAGTSSLHTFANDLFGEGRLRSTLVLWLGFFLCVLTLHLILNWLPLLLQARGLSRNAAALAQAGFGIGGAAGALLTGALLDTRWRRASIAVIVIVLPVVVLLLAISAATSGLMLGLTIVLGIGILSSQVILYGVAGTIYSRASRGTGVGSAVGVGRAGSIVGPALVAVLIGIGRTPAQVLLGVLPIVIACGIGVAVLGHWHYRREGLLSAGLRAQPTE